MTTFYRVSVVLLVLSAMAFAAAPAQVSDTTSAPADTAAASADTTSAPADTATAPADTTVVSSQPDTASVPLPPDSAVAAADTAAADSARVVDLIDVDTRAEDTDPALIRITVETIEWKRQDAMARVDTAALRKIYSQDLTYTHSMGLTQSREQLLEMLTGGTISYDRFVTETMIWHVYQGVVVGAGSQTIELTIDQNPVTARNRYTVVYVNIDSHWRCVAYQSTPLPNVREKQMIR